MTVKGWLMSGLGKEMYKINLEYFVKSEVKKLLKSSGVLSKGFKRQ